MQILDPGAILTKSPFLNTIWIDPTQSPFA